jgi:hypothetical protein
VFSSSYGLEGRKEVFKVVIKEPYCLNRFENVKILLLFGEKVALVKTYEDVVEAMRLLGCVKYSEVYKESFKDKDL